MILSDRILSWFARVKVGTVTSSQLRKLFTTQSNVTWQNRSDELVQRRGLDLSERRNTSMFSKIGRDV